MTAAISIDDLKSPKWIAVIALAETLVNILFQIEARTSSETEVSKPQAVNVSAMG